MGGKTERKEIKAFLLPLNYKDTFKSCWTPVFLTKQLVRVLNECDGPQPHPPTSELGNKKLLFSVQALK